MNEVKCFKCGVTEGTILKRSSKNKLYPVRIIKHHLGYKPEVTVDCCWACHIKIHQRIRKEDACILSRKEAATISKKVNTKRRNARLERIYFSETIGTNVRFEEQIDYDPKTGRIAYWATFRGQHGLRLYNLM